MKLLKLGRRRRNARPAKSGRSGKVRIAPQKRKLLVAMLIAGVAFLLIIGKLFIVSMVQGDYWTGH